MRSLIIIAAMFFATIAEAQTAQETIERTIGVLIIQNATLTEQIQKAKADIERLTRELEQAKGTKK